MNTPIIEDPKKIYYKWDKVYDKLPLETKESVIPIYEAARSIFYSWEEVPLKLPNSHFTKLFNQKVELGFNDFDFESEIIEISLDTNGNKKKLTNEQLNELLHTGQFKVPSEKFPGKFHTWKITKFLMRGRDNIFKNFQNDMVRGLRFLIITGRNRFIGHKLSVLSSLRHLWKGFYLFIDLMVGLPHNNHGSIHDKLNEEMLYFLSCELLIPKEYIPDLNGYWDFLEQISCLPMDCKQLDDIKKATTNEYPKGVYKFITPTNLAIDLRLTDKRVMDVLHPVVTNIIKEINNTDWFLKFKTDEIKRLFEENVPLDEMKQEILDLGLKEKLDKIFYALKEKFSENGIPDSIYKPMVDNVTFHRLCVSIRKQCEKDLDCHIDEVILRLQHEYPYRSMVSAWMRKQVNRAQKDYIQENRFKPYQMLVMGCVNQQLPIHEYFVRRMLLFITERKQLIRQQMVRTSSFPDKQFTSHYKMILPTYWKVTKYQHTSDNIEYRVEKHRYFQWSTRYPFWRWILFFQSIYIFTLTICQFLFITFPFKTRLSYFAVFCEAPFYTSYKVCSETGKIIPNDKSRIPTMYSRIVKLWRHVWSARRKFEQSPTTGILDKNVARHFHRLWTIVLQGAMGTLLLTTVFPLVCLLLSSGSCFLGLFGPLWGLLGAIGWAFLKILIIDFDIHDNKENKFLRWFQAVFWNFLLCGLFQLIGQLLVGLILVPLLAFGCVVMAILRAAWAYFFDTLIFNILIKRFGHVPAGNDFLTRRIAGPGMAYSYKILIHPQHVVTVFLCYMESLELDLWWKQIESIICRPLNEYKTFIGDNLKYLGIALDTSHGMVQRLVKKEQEDIAEARKLMNQRIKLLNLSIFDKLFARKNIKMTSLGLKESIDICTRISQQFYQDRIQPRLTQLSPGYTETDWWGKMNMVDFQFREFVIHSFTHLFDDQILSSIEDCDEIYELQVNDLTMESYMDMFVTESYLSSPLMNSPSNSSGVHRAQSPSTVTLDYCYTQMRDIKLPVITDFWFFYSLHMKLPTPLRSDPTYHKSRFTAVKAAKRMLKWSKGRGKGVNKSCINFDLSQFQLILCHPLITCALLHARDRDNTVLNLSHPLVESVIRKCMQDNQPALTNTQKVDDLALLRDLLDSDVNIAMSQSIAEISNYSLDERSTESGVEERLFNTTNMFD